MQTLHQATAAKKAEGPMRGQNQAITLPRGTKYRTLALTFDPLGFTWKRIAVKGEQYDIVG